MTYIGSGIVTQPFLNDAFIGNGTAIYTLSIAPANKNAIIVATGTTLSGLSSVIAPNLYSLDGSTLTFNTAQANTISINVRHLGVPAIPFLVANASVGIPQLSATGTPSNTTFLRGDNTWAPVTGTVSNVSFASPASLAFSIATPTTTPVISFSNVGVTPTAVFLRGDGTWVAPSSITNTGGWSIAQVDTKLNFSYNGTLMVSISSAGVITSVANVIAAGTP